MTASLAPTPRRRGATRPLIAGALAMACALAALSGCPRHAQEQPPPDPNADAPLLYDVADYDMAEGAVTGQVRVRLARDNIELKGFWLGLRPVAEGPLLLNADVDAYCRPDRAEEISRMVADITLRALPRHDTIHVRVYWWQKVPGDDYAHHAGTWTWNAQGELLGYDEPTEPNEPRQSRER